MDDNLKEKTVCIYDDGLFMFLAERLVKEFKTVYLFTEWKSDYPRSQDDLIGKGIPGVKRISDFWDYIDKIDLFIFPGLYHADVERHLVKLGKRVWASKRGDELERYRVEANELFTELGLYRPEIKVVIGIDNLRKYLKAHDNKFIKVSNYRKDFETWKHTNYELSEPVLDELQHRLGKQKDAYEFIIESQIVGDDVVEVGYDGFSIDGKYPEYTGFGYEIKDAAYAMHVKKKSEISPLITDFNDKISDTLRKYKYRNFFSTEIRVGNDKKPVCIDFTARFPSPNSELFIEICENLADVLWHGADGVLIEPKFEQRYGVEVMIDSSWSENKWQAIQFPAKIKRWVKLRNYTIIDGTYYVLPKYTDFDNVGAVVAIGSSLKECFEKIQEYADQIKGYKLEINIGSIGKLKEAIAKGELLGIIF